jgi:GNAT superfamily N-acetyltransferase
VTKSLQIRQVDALSPAEQQSLFGWSPDPFGVGHLGLEWRPKELHLLLELEGQPVSHVGVLCHEVHSGDRILRLAGLGGVITIPEAQRQGYASQLVRHASRLAFEEWSANLGLLFCLPRMVSYYERLGWRAIEQPVQIDQSSGCIQVPIPVMVYPVAGEALLETPLVLESRPW